MCQEVVQHNDDRNSTPLLFVGWQKILLNHSRKTAEVMKAFSIAAAEA